MKINRLGRSSVAAVSAVCLVVPAVTFEVAPRAAEAVTEHVVPALASLVAPRDQFTVAPFPGSGISDLGGTPAPKVVVEPVPAVSVDGSSRPVLEPYVLVQETGVEVVDPRSGHRASAAALTPADFLNAMTAAGYLVVAVPSLFVTIPFQLLTGQRAAITKSLNQIIQAANAILKLVNKQIPPIPVPPTPQTAGLASGPAALDEVPDREPVGQNESDSGDQPDRGTDRAEAPAPGGAAAASSGEAGRVPVQPGPAAESDDSDDAAADEQDVAEDRDSAEDRDVAESAPVTKDADSDGDGDGDTDRDDDAGRTPGKPATDRESAKAGTSGSPGE